MPAVENAETISSISKPLKSERRLLNPFLKIENVWKKLGPGLVTGASDDDPSGITTYTQAGAQFGLNLLWTAFLTVPLMAAVQEMCGRIGLVTDQGIAAVIKANYPRWTIYLVAILTVPAAILNIGADLAGMGAVAHLVLPQVPTLLFTFLSATLIVTVLIFFSYKKLETIMKWLTLILLTYLFVPFLVHQDWVEVLKSTFIPHFEFNKEFIAILVALLGTTISPYLFFWEASMEAEERDFETTEGSVDFNQESSEILAIKAMRKDNLIGMFFSNFVMYFIIWTAGSILFKNGFNDIQTVDQAAQALIPLAGQGAYFLFALGVIGTGFLAIPVLAGSCSYLLSEIFNWNKGMSRKLHEAKGFYIIIIISIVCGMVMNLLNINPVQALIWTAIIYGLTSPFLIGIIMLICNNKKIMGEYTNGRLSNTLGGLCLGLMALAIVGLFLTL